MELCASKEVDEPAKFLFRKLFDIESLDFLGDPGRSERLKRSRACFNAGHRTLQAYLELIVRQKKPNSFETLRLYESYIEQIEKQEHDEPSQLTVVRVLESFSEPATAELAHREFWRVLALAPHKLSQSTKEQALAALVTYLPKYSALGRSVHSLRTATIDVLAALLDAMATAFNGRASVEPAVAVAGIVDRLLGPREVSGVPSILGELIAEQRGPLGWRDALMLGLRCSPSRSTATANLWQLMIREGDPTAAVSGPTDELTRNAMRRYSQVLYRAFETQYISKQINFFLAVDKIADETMIGEVGDSRSRTEELSTELAETRARVKAFVINQLINESVGQGIGCGIYDETGRQDGSGIHAAMTRYLFDFCFNPDFGDQHALAFLDYFLMSVRQAPFEDSSASWHDRREKRAEQALNILLSLHGRPQLTEFWARSGNRIYQLCADVPGELRAPDFRAGYAEWAKVVFEALDALIPSASKAPLEPA